VDKNQLVTLLARFNDSSVDEAKEIIALRNQYPYSQLLQTLSARVSKDHHLFGEQLELQLAAVHAADRALLKEIISAEKVSSPVRPQQISESIVTTVVETVTLSPKPEVSEQKAFSDVSTATSAAPAKEEKRAIESVVYSSDHTDGDVADELLRDLEKLNASRHNFEMLMVEYSELKPEIVKPEHKPQEVAQPETASDKKVEKEKGKEEKNEKQEKEKSGKSKRQRIIELARSKSYENNDQPTGSRKHETDELIENIKTTKREIKPESDKQKEQIAIINQFIKTSPSISSAKDRVPAPAGDLNTVKSGEFGDNIVSETLVEILIKQGKKDRAIEVLKKLIWKYPQKKSYFASQIEELKK
jgi:hypothetical protein